MAEDEKDLNRLEISILKSLANFSRYTNDDVAPLILRRENRANFFKPLRVAIQKQSSQG